MAITPKRIENIDQLHAILQRAKQLEMTS